MEYTSNSTAHPQGRACNLPNACAFCVGSRSSPRCGAQLEKERTTAEEARQQLGEKDALIRELSKDTVQVDKER